MQLTRAARAVFAVLVLALPCPSNFEYRVRSEPSRQMEDSFASHYINIVNILLPAGNGVESVFPKDTQWVVAVRIMPGFEAPESKLSLSKKYDGSVEAILIAPLGDSIIKQMTSLRRTHPEMGEDRIARDIKLVDVTVGSKQAPELKRLAEELGATRLELTLPDDLITDPTRYEFWSTSQWGAKIHLTMEGSSFHPQRYPLLAWADEFHRIALRYLAQGAVTNR